MSEQDLRLGILNTLLTTPHKDMVAINAVHSNMVQQDPLFYQHLAVWYFATGQIRDHKEAFVTNLCLSKFDGHRDIGLALLREMPTFQVANIVDFIHGKAVKRKVTTKVNGKTVINTVSEKSGLGKNIPRSMITEITNYLREREADQTWFESNVLTARKALKRLYALLHIKPSETAQNILFDDKPPEGSKLQALKVLANEKNPTEQAKIIMENKIPYRVASTVVHQMTPTVMLALLEVMSPQELIGSIGMLKRRGVLDNPDLAKIVNDKLVKAQKSKKVSGLKSLEAIKASGITGEVADNLNKVADAQVKARGKITAPTALIVDKSGSLQSAISIGKALAATISTIATNGLYVYAVDTMPYKIKPTENTVESWNKAFQGISASGGTILSSALKVMTANKELVEQIIVVTDENENHASAFPTAYNEYCRVMNVKPRVIFIKCGTHSDLMERMLAPTGAEIETLIVGNNVDYYSIPGILDLLCKGSRLDLLMSIMQVELPTRKKEGQLLAV